MAFFVTKPLDFLAFFVLQNKKMRKEMNILATYYRLFFPQVPVFDWKKFIREHMRHFTMRRARGNINLQMGNYVTQDDIDVIKKKNLTHVFSK